MSLLRSSSFLMVPLLGGCIFGSGDRELPPVEYSAGLSCTPRGVRLSNAPHWSTVRDCGRRAWQGGSTVIPPSSRHSTGSIPFLRVLQSLQAGTTLPRAEAPPLIAIEGGATVREALRLMEKYNVSQIPVIEDSRQLGSGL